MTTTAPHFIQINVASQDPDSILGESFDFNFTGLNMTARLEAQREAARVAANGYTVTAIFVDGRRVQA